MSTFVLAGVDGSPESTAAALWAADEAVRRRIALRLVHVWTWQDDIRADPGQPAHARTPAERTLDHAAEQCARPTRGWSCTPDC